MSDYATPDNLTHARDRRYGEADIPGLGRVRMQSLTPSEYVKVEGIKSRAYMAMNNNKHGTFNRLSAESDEMLVALAWVDGDGKRVAPQHEGLFRDVDMAVVTALVAACKAHCGVDEGAIAKAGKNSATTDGSDSSLD